MKPSLIPILLFVLVYCNLEGQNQPSPSIKKDVCPQTDSRQQAEDTVTTSVEVILQGIQDCNTGPTTVLPCDDGNPCSINDFQIVLNVDGSICQPCNGTEVICESPDLLATLCDDGNDCTTNDIEMVSVCSGFICIPCIGDPSDCSNGPTSYVPCDDGDPCSANDYEIISECTGEVCQPCQGSASNCSNGLIFSQPCDDANPETINDSVSFNYCDGTICEPCEGFYCPNTIYLSDTIFGGTHEYHAAVEIISEQVILNAAVVYYYSGGCVTILPGHFVSPDAELEVNIQECGG